MTAANTRVLENPHFTLNSVDLSDWVMRSEERYSLSTVRKTGATDDWETAYANKKSGTLTLELKQSYGASEVNATLWAAFGTKVSFELRPDDANVSATNPKITGMVWVSDLGRGGSIEAEEGVTMTFPFDGQVTQATS